MLRVLVVDDGSGINRISKTIQVPVHISHGNLLRLLAGFTIERPLRRQSREGGVAQLDTRGGANVSCGSTKTDLQRQTRLIYG